METLRKGTVAPSISEDFNSFIDKGEFPNDLIHADIVPLQKKKSKTNKINYRVVNILSNFSKLYEKLIYK